MFEELKKIIKNSYSNISNYKVACIVKMKDGKTFHGVNVENPSFKDGMCAEQVAIGTAISEGYTKGDFLELYLLGDDDYSITPCFLCRQYLVEFFELDKKVISYNSEGEETIYKISDLCPYTFSERELVNDK
ncbi:MAG: cytidine deaminase [Bacilli bacterium]|nr:cytidine deaminase [Bacilli bacterium]